MPGSSGLRTFKNGSLTISLKLALELMLSFMRGQKCSLMDERSRRLNEHH